jgi:preprotein translocase subunit SecF
MTTMSKNFTAKTSPKWILWSVITALVLVVGVLLTAIFGANTPIDKQSTQKLVVNVPMANTFYEEEVANIEEICEQAIADAGLTALAVSYDDIATAEHELVYSFEMDADLAALKDALQAKLREAYPDQDLATTMSYHEVVLETLPGGDATFVVRNALAAVVMAVAAFVYVSLRYKLWNGITAFVSTLGTGAIALGLLLITRVPFTAAAVYGVMVAMLVSVALSVLFANKVEQEEKNGALTDAEALSNAVPVCDTVKLCGGVAVALLVVGVVGIFCAANFAWFALVAAFGLLAAAYSALLLAPSVFLAVRKPFAKAAAEKSRYDYKKGAKKEKKEEKVEETTEE